MNNIVPKKHTRFEIKHSREKTMSKVLRQYTISGGFSKYASVTDFSANIAHKPLRYGSGSVCNGFLMWCFFLDVVDVLT